MRNISIVLFWIGCAVFALYIIKLQANLLTGATYMDAGEIAKPFLDLAITLSIFVVSLIANQLARKK